MKLNLISWENARYLLKYLEPDVDTKYYPAGYYLISCPALNFFFCWITDNKDYQISIPSLAYTDTTSNKLWQIFDPYLANTDTTSARLWRISGPSLANMDTTSTRLWRIKIAPLPDEK